MIIGVCGYGFSGSGALLDLFKESDKLNIISNGEFNLLYYPDGIEELHYHLCEGHFRYFSSDVAINRFLRRISLYLKDKGLKGNKKQKIERISREYINNISGVSWYGYWGIDFQESEGVLKKTLLRFYNKIYNYRSKGGKQTKPDRRMFLSINPPEFLENTKKYLLEFLKIFGLKTDSINVIDQVFPADNVVPFLKYFDDCVAIIVDRDPRDMFLLAKKALKNQARWIPTDDVENFIKYYRILRENENSTNSKILHIQFEDLIYDYDNVIRRLSSFLNIKIKGNFNYFNPEVSINNTQLFLDDSRYKEDIEKIEISLKEYLYDFERYNKVPNRSTKLF